MTVEKNHAIRHQDRGRDPTDLEAWQKLNVASFLTGGIAAAFPECIGDPYETVPARNICR